MTSNITYKDVLSEIDGGACILATVLYKKGLNTYDQYYGIRAKYCFKKFNEKYGGSAAVPDDGIPASIISFWEKVDALLDDTFQKRDISISKVNTKIKIDDLDNEEMIHAIGKMGPVDCAFELVFGTQLKRKHKIDVVKKVQAYNEANGTDLVPGCLVLGIKESKDDDDDDDKEPNVVRGIPMDDTFTKGGKLKTEGWQKLLDGFQEARDALEDKVRAVMNKEYAQMPTNPSNCGFCPFHNVSFKIQKPDGSIEKVACSGYLHAA